MKFKTTISVLLLLLTVTFTAMAKKPKTKVIAHRGVWKYTNLPQNSIASLDAAIKLGCYGSEFDVHITKDNVLVVNHDPDFYGIKIATATYQDLLAKKHPNGESIPTLEEYLKEGMKQKKTRLILEIKTSTSKERTLKNAEMCVAAVQKLKADKLVDYIMFDFDAGKRVAELVPHANIAYLNGDLSPSEVKKAGYNGIDYHFSVFDKHPDWIAEAKKEGVSINVWTVNKKEDMQKFINEKVDFITTNEPELVFDVLKGK